MNSIYETNMCLLDVQYLLHFSLVGTHFLFSVSVRSVVEAVTGLLHGPAAAGVHRRPWRRSDSDARAGTEFLQVVQWPGQAPWQAQAQAAC